MQVAERAYDEIVDLFARGTPPEEIVRFRPSRSAMKTSPVRRFGASSFRPSCCGARRRGWPTGRETHRRSTLLFLKVTASCWRVLACFRWNQGICGGVVGG